MRHNKGVRRPSGVSDQEAFWLKVEILPFADACWLWKPKGKVNGYGKFNTLNPHKQWLAHRYAYEITYGKIPDDLTIDHACNVRLCVNPEHLYLATLGDNTRRNTWSITHCPNGHEYTPANTRIEINSGKWEIRHCRKCHTIQERNRRERFRNL